MRKFSEIEKQYKEKQLLWKTSIKQEPNKFKRFCKWVWFLIAYPWCWMWTNIRDWKTALIFVIVTLLVSSEVWVPYLIGVIIPSTRVYMFSIGSFWWIFWLGPGTPFLVIVIGITISVKALFNKIKKKSV